MESSQTEFDLWDNLLDYIHDGNVIPIVGDGLLNLNGASGNANLYKIVATRLAEQLKIPIEGLSEDRPLDDVITRHLSANGQRIHLYGKVKAILSEQKEIPPALLKLAEIREFKLFVTTTFDTMLERALIAVRGATTERLDYSPGNTKDLPDKLNPDQTYIYHLLGVQASAPTYALTQEDLLECMVELMHKGRPQKLFDYLMRHHLLFIGTGFTDWLARLVMRLAKGTRTSDDRGFGEFLVDPAAQRDRNLVKFLELFSKPTAIYQDGNAEQFVTELHKRYMERFGASQDKSAGAAKRNATVIPQSAAVRSLGSVFLSYAHEDLDAAQVIHDSLTGAGIKVWFDKRGLELGVDWEKEIGSQIRACALFLPLISKTTEQVMGRRAFISEWNLAEGLDMQTLHGIPFLVPALIDDVVMGDTTRVPERFKKAQCKSMPRGQITPEFVDAIRNNLERLANAGKAGKL